MFGRREHVDTVTVPKSEYLALCDRASSETARRVLGDQPLSSAPAWVTERREQRSQAVVPAVSEAQLQLILEAHYREVLGSKTGRAMWRRLLREAGAVEVVANLGR